MPPALKTIVDPSGTDLMNAFSAAETSVAPLASIEDGTLTVRVVTGAAERAGAGRGKATMSRGRGRGGRKADDRAVVARVRLDRIGAADSAPGSAGIE